MGRKSIGAVPEETADIYDAEAEQLGLSRSQYIRRCIDAGRTIFQSSDQADIKRLRELTEESQTSIDSDLVTADSDLAGAILTNLPTEEHRALSKEEIRKAVFGTKDEQQKNVMDALKKLRQNGEIESLVGDRYIKNND